MITEEAISDKILSLPFGVVLAGILSLALIFTALLIAISLIIQISASKLIVLLIMGFVTIRLGYFIITGK